MAGRFLSRARGDPHKAERLGGRMEISWGSFWLCILYNMKGLIFLFQDGLFCVQTCLCVINVFPIFSRVYRHFALPVLK